MNNVQISDPQQPGYGDGDFSFQAAGGYEGLTKLCNAFYAAMETLPEAQRIREMHPADLTESSEKLARFLSGWLGGPKLYREKYGPIRIPAAHAHLDIGPAERDAWLKCMEVALQSQPYADDFKAYLMQQLFVPAERSRTRD